MQNKKRIEKKWFTESDLEPLTKTQLIHVIVSGVQGFEGLERTILWNHGDSCSECRSIAKQLEPQKPGAHGKKWQVHKQFIQEEKDDENIY